MTHNNDAKPTVGCFLHTSATAELKEEVAKELEIKDEAKASLADLLSENEHGETNSGCCGNCDKDT